MAHQIRSLSPLLRGVGVLVAACLVTLVAPALIVQVEGNHAPSDALLYGGQFFGFVVCGLAYTYTQWAWRNCPRTSSQRLVSTHIGSASGILAVACYFAAYLLFALVGAYVSAMSVTHIFGLERYVQLCALGFLAVGFLLVVFIKHLRRHLLAFIAVCALALVVLILGVGLISELMGSRLIAAPVHNEASSFEQRAWVLLSSIFPAAVVFLMSERPGVEAKFTRITPVRLAQVFVPVLALLAVSTYFDVTLGQVVLPGEISALIFAQIFLGQAGIWAGGVVFAIAGVAGVCVGGWFLTRMLVTLGQENVLARSVATLDSWRTRLVLMGVGFLLGAGFLFFLDSLLDVVMLFTLVVSLLCLLVCVALAFRGHSLMRQSLDMTERRSGKVSKWVFMPASLALVVHLLVLARLASHFVVLTLALVGVPTLVLLFLRAGRVSTRARLAAHDLTRGRTLATRVHGVVLVGALDLPSLRALTFARSARLTSLTAVTVDYDSAATARLRHEWQEAAIPVSLTVLGTPLGASVANVVDYVRSLRQLRPADIVMVYVPKVIGEGMWQRFMLRHATPRIISALRMERGVVICEVPYVIGQEGAPAENDASEEREV